MGCSIHYIQKEKKERSWFDEIQLQDIVLLNWFVMIAHPELACDKATNSPSEECKNYFSTRTQFGLLITQPLYVEIWGNAFPEGVGLSTSTQQ